MNSRLEDGSQSGDAYRFGFHKRWNASEHGRWNARKTKSTQLITLRRAAMILRQVKPYFVIQLDNVW
jgi:hypothetical protein